MKNNIEITLLSKEEYSQYKNIIPKITEPWWLRSPGYSSYSANNVDSGGYLGSSDNVNNTKGIRPALHMNLVNLKSLSAGDKIRVGSKSFTILSWEGDEVFVLCDEFIATHRFGFNSNQWETSELKQWLETEGMKFIF